MELFFPNESFKSFCKASFWQFKMAQKSCNSEKKLQIKSAWSKKKNASSIYQRKQNVLLSQIKVVKIFRFEQQNKKLLLSFQESFPVQMKNGNVPKLSVQMHRKKRFTYIHWIENEERKMSHDQHSLKNQIHCLVVNKKKIHPHMHRAGPSRPP